MPNDEQILKDIVQQFIDQSGKQKLFDERRVLLLWEEKMDDSIKQYAKCRDIQKGVLKVKILNAALRFEMMARKSEIINQLNQWAGVEVVKDILFQ